MSRRGVSVAAVVVLVALGGLVLALVRPAAPGGDPARSVALTLRCPSCGGESVADSPAPLAEAMRLVVAEQLAGGSSPDEVRSWFAQRYGDEVLLDPPARGAAWWSWVMPVGVVAAAVGLLLRRRGPRWWPPVGAAAVAVLLMGLWVLPRDATRTGTDAAGPDPVDAVAVLREAVAAEPARPVLRLALARQMADAGLHDAAAQQHAALVRLAPLDADVRYRWAFSLERAGRHDEAVAALEESLAVAPEHPPTLLLLGTLQRDEDPVRAAALLTTFLRVAPDDDPDGQVRAWLRQVAPAAGTGGTP